MAEFKRNGCYIVDEVSYLCIGFTQNDEQAVLAPFWSDDEDCSPNIQNDDYIVLENVVPEEVFEFEGTMQGYVTFESK
jgi:hypothetical protein